MDLASTLLLLIVVFCLCGIGILLDQIKDILNEIKNLIAKGVR